MTGKQPKLEAALGGVRNDKAVLAVVKFNRGHYWKLEENLTWRQIQKKNFVLSSLDEKKSKGELIRDDSGSGMPKIVKVNQTDFKQSALPKKNSSTGNSWWWLLGLLQTTMIGVIIFFIITAMKDY